jgi:tektin-1
MATRSRPKNFPSGEPIEQTRRGQLHKLPGPQKPHPGYPGYGPPLPGNDLMVGGTQTSQRTPAGVEKYYAGWNSTNIRSNQLAETERLSAERILQETKELITETKVKTRQDAKEVETRFRQRVGDIDFWKSELEKKLSNLKDTLEEADEQKSRVDQALLSLQEPLAASEKCLANRAQRQGVDKVDDNVHKHLNLEVETIKNSQVLLRQTQMQIAEEVRQLQKTKYIIDKDLEDKSAAMDIDKTTSTLKVSGPDKKKGVTKYAAPPQANIYSPADWQEYSEHNLGVANGQINSAINLKSTSDGILAHITSHLRSQKDLTDRAFGRRITEVKQAKNLLEEQLAETTIKIGQMEESVESLNKALLSKQGPLATCQLRIQQRKQRPNIELVLDDVDVQLQNEAANLIDSINKLEAHLAKARNCYASLQKSRLELEAQISVKTQSIYIDEVKCVTTRQGVAIQAY